MRDECDWLHVLTADTLAIDDTDAKLLQVLEKEGGVGNGVRTRDFRSHSPALYR